MNLSCLLLILQIYELSENRIICTDPTKNLTEIGSDNCILFNSDISNLGIERKEEVTDISLKLKGNNLSSKKTASNVTNRHGGLKRFTQNIFELDNDIQNTISKKSKPNKNFTTYLPKNESSTKKLYKKHKTSNNNVCISADNQSSGLEKKGIYNSIENDKELKKELTQNKNEKKHRNPDFIFNTNPLTNKSIDIINSINLDHSMYERNEKVINKYMHNVFLSKHTINNKLKLVPLESLQTSNSSHLKCIENTIKNIEKMDNDFKNNNIRLANLYEHNVNHKKIDSSLHCKNVVTNDFNKIKNNIETHKDVKINNVQSCVDSIRKNYLEIQKERIVTIEKSMKYYNFINRLELKTDILEHLEILKKNIVECTKIDSGCLEIILCDIKQIIKLLLIWASLIDQIPPDTTILDTSLHNKLISLLLNIKNTTNGRILFPEILFYDIKYSYYYTFKKKSNLCQNIIQKLLFEIFEIFMDKILHIDNISDIITIGQHMKLKIIRQILREFMYFTLESLFLENFKLLYKHFLHVVLSTNEKQYQTILVGLYYKDYQIYDTNPFNSFLYHFRFIFLFTNPYNYIHCETDELTTNMVTRKILITDNERFILSYSNMADFLTSLLLYKSLESFVYNLKQKKGQLECYISLYLVYLQELYNILYFSSQIKSIIKVTDINIRNYLKSIKMHNMCCPLNNIERNKIFAEKARILVKIFNEFKDLVKEIENFEYEKLFNK